MMFAEGPPPSHYVSVPHYQFARRKPSMFRRCFKCLCYCYCLLVILVLVLASTALFLYLFWQPKAPSYEVEDMRINAFNIGLDFSVHAEFIVTVKAENPNKKLGIIYGKDGMVNVSYSGSTLCSGKLPAFYQGHENTTMMNVVLKGKSTFGSGFHEALMSSVHTGRIPLMIKVRVPVRITLGVLSLRQFVVLVNGSFVVDNLSPKKKVTILSSNYEADVEF